MTLSPRQDEAGSAAGGTQRDLLGNVCFYLHFAIMLYIVLGWLAPWKVALIFYVTFLPCVALQWLVNKNSCVLNNFESLLRFGQWRDPANEEEGAWLLTLARDTLGVRATPGQMDAFIYAVLAFLWVLGVGHSVMASAWHFGP
jgi:hypothetical protein